VIRDSDRAHPADSVLRVALQESPGVSRVDAREVARLVFVYFRWKGWLASDGEDPDRDLRRTEELESQFSHDPRSIADAELIRRVVPSWVAEQVEVSPAWARALQQPSRLWLRARPGMAAWLSDALGQCRPASTPLCPDAVWFAGDADLYRSREFQSGDFEIQDLSSQAVGQLCAPQAGETWWDACAGEGGKMLHLSDLLGNKGLIWASDRAEWRLKRLKQRAARARVFNYRSALWDGGERLPTKTRFDGILVDAPCSGLGTWHRNPHARWTTTPVDVRELAEVQLGLLRNVCRSLKPGGRLVYAVCTLTRSETTELAAAFEAGDHGLEPSPLAVPAALRTSSPASHQLWLRQQDFGGNGMFIAAWRKPSS
jgi:16S rRNA (cytosine967-C5)-methyltransferase